MFNQCPKCYNETTVVYEDKGQKLCPSCFIAKFDFIPKDEIDHWVTLPSGARFPISKDEARNKELEIGQDVEKIRKDAMEDVERKGWYKDVDEKPLNNFDIELSKSVSVIISDKKKLKELYNSNSEVRDIVDVASAYTQGDYGRIRDISSHSDIQDYVKDYLFERTKSLGKDSVERESVDWSLEIGSSGLNEIKNINGEEMKRLSIGKAIRGVRMLERSVDNAPIQNFPIYRGLSTRKNGKFVIGEKIKLDGITSFTSDFDKAEKFSLGLAGGGKGIRKGAKHIVVEVIPGHKSLDFSKISTWRQKEYVSRGEFEVIDVKENPYENSTVYKVKQL